MKFKIGDEIKLINNTFLPIEKMNKNSIRIFTVDYDWIIVGFCEDKNYVLIQDKGQTLTPIKQIIKNIQLLNN